MKQIVLISFFLAGDETRPISFGLGPGDRSRQAGDQRVDVGSFCRLHQIIFFISKFCIKNSHSMSLCDFQYISSDSLTIEKIADSCIGR